MKFQYSHLSSGQFESLVIHLCYELLGFATETFSDGKDGGRDSRFEGRANLYPSSAEPWTGVTIIQAKHTSAYNKKFSDGEFYGTASSEIDGEIPKIARLIENDSLRNYFLFSNRKLPANASSNIREYISSQTGLHSSNIGLVGVEQFENYFKRFKHIPENVGLNPFDMPLNIEPDELAEIIVSLKKNLKAINKADIDKKIVRVSFERKNQINNLSAQYGNTIKKRIGEMYQVQEFLAMPENDALQQLYMQSAEELAAKICVLQGPEQKFDNILEKIIELLLERDNDLRSNKSLTRLMIYYMYYHCDIGEEDAAITE
ncbi:ABC-three component system protein [Pseudomonas bubulae]|uniref:ABC-three component system protein n=1 Tax=Pseudomonas bubulae TaxID=2316085 RepID=UPI0039A0BD51